jgi:hypothetical protein
MKNDRPVDMFPSKRLRLPQVPPRVVEATRQKYVSPVIKQRFTLPQTPRPGARLPIPIETRLPDTPPVVLRYRPHTRSPYARSGAARHLPMRYIPHGATRRETSVGEALLGCGVLIVLGILVLIALYYVSSSF